MAGALHTKQIVHELHFWKDVAAKHVAGHKLRNHGRQQALLDVGNTASLPTHDTVVGAKGPLAIQYGIRTTLPLWRIKT